MTTSPLDGRSMRPSVMRTLSCTASAASSTPRTSTFSRPPSTVWKKGWTTSCGETSGRSPSSRATPSKKRTAMSASRGSWLEPSLSAPLRSTTRFSGSPLSTSVRLMLDTSPRKRLAATTTSAITPTVTALRVGRAITFRRL
jgi:hypothetical protein